MKKNRIRFGQLGPDAQLDWKILCYQWCATVMPFFSLPSLVPFTPHVLWHPPTSHCNNPQVFMTSLSCCDILFVPDIPGNPGSWKCLPQADLLLHQWDPHLYLQLQLPCQPISSVLCPMLRTSYTIWCAALLSHIFPHWSTFKPSRKLPEINPAFTVFLKIFFFPLSPATQGLC